MKPKPYTLLLHPVFLFSLGLLLVNDLYLKYAFHNGLTGKLSDFAGLFAFAVFLSVFFPAHKKIVVLLTTLLFVWWKSPFSSSLINFLNTGFHLPVNRVIDYSDYIAVLVMPLTFYIKPVNYPASGIRQVAIGCSCIVSFFSFIADSLPRHMTEDSKINLAKHIKTKKTKKEIVTAIETNGMKLQEVPAIYDKSWEYNYYVKTTDANGTVRMRRVDSIYSGLYTKINYGSCYVIPEVPIGSDTIQNLEMIISDAGPRKYDIELHTFQYKHDSAAPYYSGYYTWRRFKGALRKKFKSILK